MALLLILLPLYLWPLRGGLSGPPGTSALPGSVRDPRSAAAVAQIPGDVWNALMGRTPTAPPSSRSTRPRPNLTMITSAEVLGSGLPGLDDGQLFDSASALARGLLAQFGTTGVPNGISGGRDVASLSTDPASASEDGAGTGGAPSEFSLGGYSGFGSLGPWTSGGSGGRPPVSGLVLALDAGPGVLALDAGPGDLAPTPEPATLVLVGSNLALLGAAAWKRRRRRLGVPPRS